MTFKDWSILPEHVLEHITDVVESQKDRPHVLAFRLRNYEAAAGMAAILERLDKEALLKLTASNVVSECIDAGFDLEAVAVKSSALAIRTEAKLKVAMQFVEKCCLGNTELWRRIQLAIKSCG